MAAFHGLFGCHYSPEFSAGLPDSRPRITGADCDAGRVKGGAAMLNSTQHVTLGAARQDFWASHREATMNWLALGLLLAAWNAVDNRPAPDLRRRPEALKGYAYVSVRAAQRLDVTVL
jgi:hypothetical protein